ncbi:hypothetical protein BOTBODRAFT_458731 [Botryobasidium botryosum FD-172 SS1]|uniref:Uncharacterized protein n=1 Tax=Botryobasidium botryosum (strain FD-172 SS1) TaxID=930990 RepID=A0A067MII4_BOTB1|nr:hypothetical protein BOTBODRAFT_458731 [Botryobasidium botryosum FD-172 SS1]
MNACYNTLNTSHLIGLSFTAEAGFLSITAVLALFGIVVKNAIVRKRQPFRTHGDIYATSLFIGDVFQGVGSMLDLRWVRGQAVWCGSYCSAQGAFQTIGGTSIAFSTLAISVFTFSCLFLGWNPPESKLIPILVVVCAWLYSILFAAIGYAVYPKAPTDDGIPLYVPSPYWCWLQDSVPLRVFGEYLWIWIALVASIFLYVPLFFLLRGKIFVEIKEWHWIQYPSISRSRTERAISISKRRTYAEARRMLYYPGAYALTALPQIIARWSKAPAQVPIYERPFAGTSAAIFIFSLSGVVNVLLFLHTRPSMLGFGDDQSPPVLNRPVHEVLHHVVATCPECHNRRNMPCAPPPRSKLPPRKKEAIEEGEDSGAEVLEIVPTVWIGRDGTTSNYSISISEISL